MDFDVNSLIASFVVSSVGFVLFIYGKRMSRAPHLVVGLVLLIYPYFIGAVLPMFGIALVLVTLLWFAVKRGF
jgi:predicted cobalt transporter CbtA